MEDLRDLIVNCKTDKEAMKIINKVTEKNLQIQINAEAKRQIIAKASFCGREIMRKEILELISNLPYIICLRDAEGNDKISKSWKEQFIIRREELKQKIDQLK